METNPFYRLFQFNESDKKSPLENFSTELFVFILKYLIKKEDIRANKILNLFGIYKYKKLKIYTQYSTVAENRQVYPDILLELEDKRIIIEVKIDSKLNNYGKMNQIQLYSKIKNINSVYLLTRGIINLDNNNYRRFWSEIYNVLLDSNDFVIKNYLEYLEVNNMGSYKIDKNIFNALNSIENLKNLIIQSWPVEYNYNIKQFTYSGSEGGCIGYYIYKDKKKLFWIGMYDDEYLLFNIMNETIKNKIDKKHPEWSADQYTFSKLDLNEIIKEKTNEDQKLILNNWLVTNLKNIEKFM